MGGYGGFVWPAFGITLLVLAVMLGASWRTLKRREAALAMLRQAPDGTGETPR